jgi:hypothetical protein
MRRIYICLHKRNVERSSDVEKGIALSPMLARSAPRKMVLEGRVKTQRGGQNAILVDIAHILQLQHPSPNPVIAEKHLRGLEARRCPRDAIAMLR